jgi:DNA polymerase III, epsilon subunit and related 3''-5'' exonucleases
MRLAIIDCETTGIEDDDEPISLGVVVVELGADGVGYPQARIYQEREPSIAISPDAELVHGLTSFALHGKSFDKSIILETMADTECVVSHNARFDARMLAKVLPEALSWSWRCTLKQRPFFDVPQGSLQAICERFGISRPSVHNALSDAEALLQALNQRPGKTTRSKTYLQRVVASPRWPVFATRDPFLALNSSDNILFSSLSEKVLLECQPGTQIRLWTHQGIDFVVGYARINGYCGGQGECFRFSKRDNPHIVAKLESGQEYIVQDISDSGVLISPAHA